MANRALTLFTIDMSHFSEKIRWLLDYEEIPYQEIALTPALHTVPMWLKGRRALEPLLAYPTVSLRQNRVTAARKSEEGFVLQSDDGQEVKGRTLILATGVADQLPDIPGLKERWGKSVIHCPYCHGYELRGQPIAVLAGSAHSAMQAAMLPDWGPTTYFTQGDFEPDDDLLPVLTRRGVTIERTPIVAIEGEGGGEGDAVSAVRLADVRSAPFMWRRKLRLRSHWLSNWGLLPKRHPPGK